MKINNLKYNKLNVSLSSKPEKVVMAMALSVAGALIFDQKKRREKGSPKYQNFFKRVKKNYKIADSMLAKTVAKDLKENVQSFDSDVLNNLTIQKGEFIDID